MVIPPIRWSDIQLRGAGIRVPPLLESQQYLLYMLLSLVQMNPSLFIADWTETDAFDINDFLNECMNAILDENTVTYPLFLQMDIFCTNSEPLSGAGALTYNPHASLPFGYSMSNTNNSEYGLENFIWLQAGNYDYDGWASLVTNGGNTVVSIVDGVSIIDEIIPAVSQAGAFGTRVHHTGSFTIPEDGLYRIVAANNGTGSGSNRQMNWTSHHIRQVP